ncbi:MAG: gluconate 2-dehydrogenase subunit 3 family protein [Vicinamibacterales bacterium]
MLDIQNRRAFLRAAMAAGAAWATADLLQVEDALAFAAHQAPATGAAVAAALTPAQRAVVETLVSRIIPAVDGRPGAREVGAARFIDRALATFNAGQKAAYAAGVADLNRRAAAKQAGATFDRLPPAQQDEVLRDVEQTPFFQMARFDTIVGTFGLPTYGGNQDYAGWHMIGFDHQPRFQAPFGYYDAQPAGRD